MSDITAIVVSHANPAGLRHILGQLRYQTRPADETIVLCSDTPDLARLREDFPEAEFLERPNRDDWGHEKRAEGLNRATKQWVGFFNDDDLYTRTYIDKMLARTPGHIAVFCEWNEYAGCDFAYESSTAGNFIVNRTVALKAGYFDRHYQADGTFIARIAKLGTAAKVDELLYQHNRGIRDGRT